MKYIFIMSIIILAFNLNLISQNTNDTIFVSKSFWGNSYIINDIKYSKSELEQKISVNNEIASLISKSKTQKVIGTIALPIGVFLTIASIHEIIIAQYNYDNFENNGTSKLPDLFPLLVGGAVVLDIVGILLLSSSKRHFNSAINLYNGKILETKQTYNELLDLHIGINQISLTFKF